MVQGNPQAASDAHFRKVLPTMFAGSPPREHRPNPFEEVLRRTLANGELHLSTGVATALTSYVHHEIGGVVARPSDLYVQLGLQVATLLANGAGVDDVMRHIEVALHPKQS